MSAERLPAVSAWPDEVFDSLVADNSSLDRLQLYSHGKAIESGLVRAGHWGVPKDEGMLDLGRSVDILVLARRPKAIDTSAGEYQVVYDPFDPEFDRIRRLALAPDSDGMFGVSFLVFERATRCLYELFLGTRTTRPLAKELFSYLPLTLAEINAKGLRQMPRGPRPVTLSSTLRTTTPFPWYVPELKTCAAAIEGLPPDEYLIRESMTFLNQ